VKTIYSLLLLAALGLLPAFSSFGSDDSNLKVSQTNAVAGATNYTAALDLGNAETSTLWETAFIRATIPLLPNATNAATTLTFILQTSTNNSTWTVTSPLIQGQIVGASAATNTATVIKFPIPPDVNRYLRIQQVAPADSGNSSTKTNVYQLVVP